MTLPTRLARLASRPPDIQRHAAQLLDGTRHLAVDEMRRRAWVVAPLPDAISDEQAALLAAAAHRRGVEAAIAITTEPVANEEQFEVPMTPDGIMDFDFNCLLRHFLLMPRDGSFAIVHEANFYWLLAGDPDFVAEALGQSPVKVFERFIDDYANAEEWPPKIAAMLREVARYLVLFEEPGR